MNLFPISHKVEIKLLNETHFITDLKLRTAKDIYSTKNKHFFIGNVKPNHFLIKSSKNNTRNNYFHIKGELVNSNLIIRTVIPPTFIIILALWVVTMTIFFFYIDKAWFLLPVLIFTTFFWYIINIIIAVIFKSKAIQIIESIVIMAKTSNENLN